MQNVQHLLVVFLISALASSCAFGMGQRRTSCEPPTLPIRPIYVYCISDASGIGQCYNPATGKNEVRSMNNYVCTSPEDNQSQEEWIKTILGAQ